MIRHLQKLLLILALLASGSVQLTAQLDRAIQFHGLAEGNYLIGDNQGALRTLNECLRIQPDYMPALRLKARIQIDEGRFEAARATIRIARRYDPHDVETKLLQALLMGQQGERDTALQNIDEIIRETTPESKEGRIARQLFGILQMAEGNWDHAAEAFSSIARNAPANRKLATEAYLSKVDNLVDEEKYNAALRTINQAIDLYDGPNSLEEIEQRDALRFKRAKILAMMENTDGAIEAMQRLIAEKPQALEVHLTLASLFVTSEKWDDLEDLLPYFAEQKTLQDILLYFEGRIALSRYRVGTARAKFESGLAVATEEGNRLKPVLHYYRGVCLARLNRLDEARQSMVEAFEFGYQAETAEEAELLGKLFLPTDQVNLAIPVMETALLRGKTTEDLWAILGRAHWKTGNDSLAVSAFNEALRFSPGRAEVRALRGSLLRKMGDLEGALSDYLVALSRTPENPVLNYEAGLVLLQLGRIDESEGRLRIAARELNDQPTLDLLHASTAYIVGEREHALKSVEEYLNPELHQGALEQHQRALPDTILYLKDLLDHDTAPEIKAETPISEAVRLFRSYRFGQASRKEVLDWAGQAQTQEQARSQIAVAAFWLAQHEKEIGNTIAHQDLRQITLDFGRPENPEWQYARWQEQQELDALSGF